MASRIKQQLVEMRKSLEKLLVEEDEEEKLLDELVVLSAMPMTAELIRESKLGKVISNVKEKFDQKSHKIASKAKEILVDWKKIVEQQKFAAAISTSTASASHTEHKHHTAELAATFNTKASEVSTSHPDFKAYLSTLTPTRKAIVLVFTNTFKTSANPAMSEKVAIGIEEALEGQFPSGDVSTAKQYTVRAKLLTFNIRKNDVRSTYIS